MPDNDWIKHVKQFAEKNNLTYGCAISNPECKKTYVKRSKDDKELEKLNKARRDAVFYLYKIYKNNGYEVDSDIKSRFLNFPKETKQLLKELKPNFYNKLK